MSYTSKGQPQGIAYCITNKIREAMISEIVAINSYAQHIANSSMEKLNNAWEAIIEDERKHYGMLLTLLRSYDPTQYKAYQYFENKKTNSIEPLQVYLPNYDKQLILNNLREDIKGELEAVILYEQECIDIPCKDIRRVFHSIMNDEKYHFEHLTQILLNYDSDKSNLLANFSGANKKQIM